MIMETHVPDPSLTSTMSRLERKLGGGIWIVLGLVLLAGAGLLIWKQMGRQWTTMDSVMFVVLVVGAAVFLFGRRRKSVNAETRTVRDTWTLIARIRDRRWSFDRFDRIELTEEIRRSDKHTYTVYPVRLVGKARFHWMEHRKYEKSRGVAEELARVAGFSLHDSSGGATTVRAPHEIDQSLRDRIQSRGGDAELPPRPAVFRSRLSLEGERVVIETPGVSTTRRFLLPMIAIFLVACGLMAYCLTALDEAAQEARPGLVVTALVAFFIFMPFLLFVGIYTMISPRRTRVVASPAGIEIDQRVFVGNKLTSIASVEIEDIALADSGTKKGIVIRSDNTVVSFGGSLSREERAYIHGLLRAVVTA